MNEKSDEIKEKLPTQNIAGQPTTTEYDDRIKRLSKSVSMRFNIFGQRVERVNDKQSQQQAAVEELEASVADAAKVITELNSYAGNIASNIQNIADKMGAYVTTLKETREALQDERELTLPTGVAAPTAVALQSKKKKSAEEASQDTLFSAIGEVLETIIKNLEASILAKILGSVIRVPPSLFGSGLGALGAFTLGAAPLAVLGIITHWAGSADINDNDSINPFNFVARGGKKFADWFNEKTGRTKEWEEANKRIAEKQEAGELPMKGPGAKSATAEETIRAYEEKLANAKTPQEREALQNVVNQLKRTHGTPAPTPSADATPAIQPPPAPDAAKVPMESAVAESGTIVEVVEVGAGYNVVKLDDGTTVRREGSRNWRNNNPGNIVYNAFSKSLGALPMPAGANGDAARYAIFPTYEAGRAAQANLLFSNNNYKKLTVSQAIARWAPATENDTKRYQATVQNAVGGDIRLSDMNENQRLAMLNTMQRVEGFKQGKVTVVKAAGPSATAAAAPSIVPSAKPATAALTETAPDVSLAKQPPAAPFTGGAQSVATPQTTTPSTGAAISEASVTAAALKTAPKKDVAVIDNSAYSSSKMGNLFGSGKIPSPVANRGSVDTFNYFNPPGIMKAEQ